MTRRAAAEHGLFKSSIVAVGVTAETVDIPVNLESHYIGVRYYADANGSATATPGAGTVAIEALDEATNQWTTASGSPLDATDVTAKASIQGNVSKVRAVPTGITTATHYQLFVSSNL